MPSRRTSWWRRDRVVDVAAALVLAGGAVVDAVLVAHRGPLQSALLVTLAVVATLTVATRRRAPVASAWVCLAAVASYELASADPRFTFEPYAVLLVTYLVGRTESQHDKTGHRSVLLGAAAAFVAVVLASGQTVLAAVPAFVVFAGVPYGVGVLVSRREAKADRLATRIATLQDEQQLRGRVAAQDERMRVARELHDVAAQCLTAMVVQGSAARVVALRDPEAAAQALAALVHSGRTALAELRRVSELPSGLEEPPAPLGLLAFLSTLEPVGVSPDLAWPDGPRDVPAHVEPVAVRTLQEALTNATRHAPNAPVSVRVRIARAWLDLRVENGPSDQPPRDGADGFGLVGMRERVEAAGGSLSTGSTPSGGYAVHARLPCEPVAEGPGSRGLPGRRRRDRWWTVGVPAGWLVALVTEASVSDHRSGPLLLNVLVVAAMALCGLVRRRAPVTFLVAASGLSVLLSTGLTSRDYATLTGLYAVLVPAYAVGCWASRWRAVVVMSLWALAATVTGLLQHATPSGLLGPLMAAGLAACLGALVQSHRLLEERLVAAEHAVREQTTALERLATESERARLAELHDRDVERVVAHMLDLASAATRLHDARDPGVVDVLVEIEADGRAALERMRTIVGSLRDGSAPPLSPAAVPA